MAYATTLKLVANDTLPVVRVTIRDASTAAAGKTLDPDDPTSWNPIDLNECSVVMRVRMIGSETLTDVLSGTIENGSGGVVSFAFTSSTLSEAGLYEAEVEVTDNAGKVFTIYDLIKFDVRDDF